MQRIEGDIGFAFDTQKGSHEQWVLIKDKRKYKVTVDFFADSYQEHGRTSRVFLPDSQAILAANQAAFLCLMKWFNESGHF